MYSSTRNYNRQSVLAPNPCRNAGRFSEELAEGLGLAKWVDERDCKQPVHYTVRDKLRAKGKDLLGYYGQRPFGIHWHEGHPDIKAFFEDVLPRIQFHVDRPRKLRCESEARRKLSAWIGNAETVKSQIKTGGFTRVVVGFDAPILNGPTYRIRSTSDPYVNAAMQAVRKGGAPTVGTPVTKGCPPKWVNLHNRCYPSHKAMKDGHPGVPMDTPPPPGAQSPGWRPAGGAPTPGAPGAPPPSMLGPPEPGGLIPGVPSAVAGIPTTWIALGVGAFLLMRFMK